MMISTRGTAVTGFLSFMRRTFLYCFFLQRRLESCVAVLGGMVPSTVSIDEAEEGKWVFKPRQIDTADGDL